MNLKESISQFNTLCDDLIALGDIKVYISINKDDFLEKINKLIQMGSYIKKNFKDTDTYFEAIDKLEEAIKDNHSLKPFIDIVLNNMLEIKVRKTIDLEEINKQINYWSGELNELNIYSSSGYEDLSDIEWQIQKIKEEFEAEKYSITKEQYDEMLKRINEILNIIKNKKNSVEQAEDIIRRV